MACSKSRAGTAKRSGVRRPKPYRRPSRAMAVPSAAYHSAPQATADPGQAAPSQAASYLRMPHHPTPVRTGPQATAAPYLAIPCHAFPIQVLAAQTNQHQNHAAGDSHPIPTRGNPQPTEPPQHGPYHANRPRTYFEIGARAALMVGGIWIELASRALMSIGRIRTVTVCLFKSKSL